MKLVSMYNGIPIYENSACKPDTLYLINDKYFATIYPKKKNGRPDMRYSVNKMQEVFDPDFRNKIIKEQQP